jgi:hypothetical protein
MSGLIERLRSPQFADVAEKYLMIEAADALEANEKEIKRLGMLVGDTIADHPYVVELMRQLKEQDAEIARLKERLSMAEGCSALSGIGVDAHSAVVKVAKDTMAKLVAAEAEIDRLRKLARHWRGNE